MSCTYFGPEIFPLLILFLSDIAVEDTTLSSDPVWAENRTHYFHNIEWMCYLLHYSRGSLYEVLLANIEITFIINQQITC